MESESIWPAVQSPSATGLVYLQQDRTTFTMPKAGLGVAGLMPPELGVAGYVKLPLTE